MIVFAIIGFVAALLVGGYVLVAGFALLRLSSAFGGSAKFETALGAAMMIAGLAIIAFAFAMSPLHISVAA